MKKTSFGKNYLHIWREGSAFEWSRDLKETLEWNNIRFSVFPGSDSDYYLVKDIRKGLPYPNNSLDGIYVNRILEHLTVDESHFFLKELYRVMKKESVLRISVPDLISKTSMYLKSFENYKREPSEENYNIYYWNMLEFIDQANREESGGLILKFAKSKKIPLSLMRSTNGDVYDYIVGNLKRKNNIFKNSISKNIQRKIVKFFVGHHPQTTREAHMWMYDDIFLTEQLKKYNFSEINVVDYKTSCIEGFVDKYQFDKSPYGDYVMEPSLFMESKK